MSFHKSGDVIFIRKHEKGIEINTYPSVTAQIQHYIVHIAMEGTWGSPEHLRALEETSKELERIIQQVREDGPRIK